MKLLTVCVLGCAMMVLARAAIMPQLVKRSSSCSNGWSEINGRCFRYVPSPTPWAKAEKNCQSLGANLASIHNVQEYHDIQRLIVTYTHDYKETWIGGYDAQQEHIWLWSDGNALQYTNWCQGEPNYRGRQNCILMNYGGEKCWDNMGCNAYRPFVCAKKV